MMIVDHHATGLEYDKETDVATVKVGAAAAPSSSTLRAPAERLVRGRLLLDAKGFLVGVDLGKAYEAQRVVVLLGTHEAVARAEEAELVLVEDDRHQLDGLDAVSIPHARTRFRVAEKNPYV